MPPSAIVRISLALVLLAVVVPGPGTTTAAAAMVSPRPTTPIAHLIVIFQENVSFDHYFGTYPIAANPPGEPRFVAAPGTPSVNGLSPALLTNNPNRVNPRRLDRFEPFTCDMDHRYTAEQAAYDHGLVDRFVQFTGARYDRCDPTQVMDYYDGNTVTALWNYAQHGAMSDNFFASTFGPSTPGALNLISGQTHGAVPANLPSRVANGTVIGAVNPAFDDCSVGPTIRMLGRNVGDLLNARGVTWGWFAAGFRPTATANGVAICGSIHQNARGVGVPDYFPDTEPFQYYPSTANPHHLPPSAVERIGETDQANHQYDLTDFWAAAEAGHLPAVSFLKAPAAQSGHPGFSDPLDEQRFLVETINRIEELPEWPDTAIVISYDDSDGWYDHVMPPIVHQSRDAADALTGDGQCGTPVEGSYPDRCGYGPRLPLLIISPWARVNYVDHTITDHSSILRFIEDNWSLGPIGDQSFDAQAGSLVGMFDFRRTEAPPLFLDPATGEPVADPAANVQTTLRSGAWIAYRFQYPGPATSVGITMRISPADPETQQGVTLDAYAPSDPPPRGVPIGSATATGPPGVKDWQLGNGTPGTYVVVIHNQDPRRRSATISLSVTDPRTGAPGPGLVLISRGG